MAQQPLPLVSLLLVEVVEQLLVRILEDLVVLVVVVWTQQALRELETLVDIPHLKEIMVALEILTPAVAAAVQEVLELLLVLELVVLVVMEL
jgi:uncharacterized membrane protein YwzB